ncbi:MAG: DUF3987 domain-containing protein [Thermoguttaceae bacterium]|nr:DUF3987 domain-containing protein [Thermoguttaceae bacterium]
MSSGATLSPYRNAQDFKEAIKPFHARILTKLCGVPAEAVANPNRHFPCPKCGGKDRFRVTDPDAGRVFCNRCYNQGNGGVVDSVIWALDVDFKGAVRAIADELGFAPPAGASTAPTKRFAPSKPLNSTQTPPKKNDYRYRDENGVERWRVVRLVWPGYVDETTGKAKKTFSLGRVVDGRFEKGLNGEKVPPYNLPELLDATRRTVCVVEGEKCADALRFLFKRVGIENAAVATTLPNGAKAAKRWSEYVDYLRGRERVFYFADADEPGEAAARTFAEIVAGAGIAAKIVVFRPVVSSIGETVAFKRPGTNEPAPEKYDVADFVDDLREDAKGKSEEERKALFARSLDELTAESSPFVFDASFFARQEGNAPDSETASSLPRREGNAPDEPPADASNDDLEEARAALEGRDAAERRAELNRRRKEAEETPDVPEGADLFPITDFAKDCARIRGVPETAYLAAAFAVLGAAVGRRFLFDEPQNDRFGTAPNVCAFLVGEPGASKSDVLKDVLAPLADVQKRFDEEFQNETRERRPVVLTRDFTPEAALRKMSDNIREGVLGGLLACVDEGAKHFSAYGSKANARDTSRYIELIEGNLSSSIRSDDAKETVVSEKSALTVVGGFQPKALLASLRDNEAVEAQGYIHRFLWVFVPWNDDTQRETAPPDKLVREIYSNVVKKIATFENEKRLVFSQEAQAELRRVRREFDATTKRLRTLGATTAGTYRRKAHKTLAQLAALVSVVRWAAGEVYDEDDSGPVREIDVESVRKAAALTRLFCDSFETTLNVLRFEETGGSPGGAFYDKYELKTLETVERLQNSDAGATKTTLARAVAYFKTDVGKSRRDEILKRFLREGVIVKRGNRYYRTENEIGDENKENGERCD